LQLFSSLVYWYIGILVSVGIGECGYWIFVFEVLVIAIIVTIVTIATTVTIATIATIATTNYPTSSIVYLLLSITFQFTDKSTPVPDHPNTNGIPIATFDTFTTN